MIDRETAIQWATDAGFVPSFLSRGFFLGTPVALEALITRAQNEAYEAAAKRADAFVYMSQNFETLAQEIREMKHD